MIVVSANSEGYVKRGITVLKNFAQRWLYERKINQFSKDPNLFQPLKYFSNQLKPSAEFEPACIQEVLESLSSDRVVSMHGLSQTLAS